MKIDHHEIGVSFNNHQRSGFARPLNRNDLTDTAIAVELQRKIVIAILALETQLQRAAGGGVGGDDIRQTIAVNVENAGGDQISPQRMLDWRIETEG